MSPALGGEWVVEFLEFWCFCSYACTHIFCTGERDKPLQATSKHKKCLHKHTQSLLAIFLFKRPVTTSHNLSCCYNPTMPLQSALHSLHCVALHLHSSSLITIQAFHSHSALQQGPTFLVLFNRSSTSE